MAVELIETEKIKYIEESLKGRCYVAAKILTNIYPTLFGSKPSTLVRLCNFRERKLFDLWEAYKTDLASPDIDIFELKRTENSVTLLFYRKELLIETLNQPKNIRFLAGYGYYEDMNIDQMLFKLRRRFKNTCPHEIGLFLGIPLKDVLGYLGMISLPCNLCGYWKVYGKADKTRDMFESFKATKKRLIDLIVAGVSPLEILRKPGSYRLLLSKELKRIREVG